MSSLILPWLNTSGLRGISSAEALLVVIISASIFGIVFLWATIYDHVKKIKGNGKTHYR